MDAAGIIAALFGAPRALVGMLHVPALPGTPRAGLGVEAVAEAMVAEARQYQSAGFHGLMIENMHDRPYLKGAVGPEVVAAMAGVGREGRRSVGPPLGGQGLAAANPEAPGVGLARGAAFVGGAGLVFGH